MAGILDSKTRVMDFILTDEGRRQVRDGDLRLAYASFSDLGTFYSEDSSGTATDASSRIYFEATPRQQDRIVVESNLGVITSFTTTGASGSYDLNGVLITTTIEQPSSASIVLELTGSQLTEEANDIIDGITNNFTENQFISKEDVFSYRQGFELSNSAISFRPNNKDPIDTWLYTAVDNTLRYPALSSFDAITFDRRFAHFPNFKFLPPVNKTGLGRLSGAQLGKYVNLNQPEIASYDDLMEELQAKPSYEIRFDPTSRDNNIILQPFEFDKINGTIQKLIIIDYGIFPNSKKTAAGVHVFFIGKILKSRDGSYKYLNIFTLEMDV